MASLKVITDRTRLEVLESFAELARLGVQLGGQYRLAASMIQADLSRRKQNQKILRDRAILNWYESFAARDSHRKDATELWSKLQKYQMTFARLPSGCAEPSIADLNTEKEFFWIILKNAGRDLGPETIRKLLPKIKLGKRFVLETTHSFSNVAGMEMNIPNQAKAIDIISQMPEFKKASSAEHARQVSERQAHIDAITKLDGASLKAAPRHDEKIGEAKEKLRIAKLQLKEAESSHNRVLFAINQEVFAHRSARENHIGALLAEDFSKIDAFIAECNREIELARKAFQYREKIERNTRTQRLTRSVINNSLQIKARVASIQESVTAAYELRFQADIRAIQKQLVSLRNSWPEIQDIGLGDQ